MVRPPFVSNPRGAFQRRRQGNSESEMKKPETGVILILVAVGALAASNATAAEKFRKLNGTQIRAKLAGMEISDESHWGDVYGRNGTVTTYSMGHKSVGKWSVRK